MVISWLHSFNTILMRWNPWCVILLLISIVRSMGLIPWLWNELSRYIMTGATFSIFEMSNYSESISHPSFHNPRMAFALPSTAISSSLVLKCCTCTSAYTLALPSLGGLYSIERWSFFYVAWKLVSFFFFYTRLTGFRSKHLNDYVK